MIFEIIWIYRSNHFFVTNVLSHSQDGNVLCVTSRQFMTKFVITNVLMQDVHTKQQEAANSKSILLPSMKSWSPSYVNIVHTKDQRNQILLDTSNMFMLQSNHSSVNIAHTKPQLIRDCLSIYKPYMLG